jgi:glycosyltransferase involved in cell wall biosynthesis
VIKSLQIAGIAVHQSPVRNLLDVSGTRKLRQLVASLQPALVHAWGTVAARLSRALVERDADGVNSPRVVISAAANVGGGLTGWLTTRAWRRADRIVAMSRAEGERYHRLGVPSERLTQIVPCVEPPESIPDGALFRSELGVPANSRFIMTAGRLESGPALKSAIWSFDMLRYEAPELRLVIFGDGPDRVGLEEFGRALAFDDFRIHFAGPRPNVPELFALAEVVWVTSEQDGSNLALEAMAAGRVVVGWRSAELAEIIEEGATGHLSDTGERAQLSAKTYPILHEAGLAEKLGSAGRSRVIEHFSVAKAIEHFSQLYGELIERRV